MYILLVDDNYEDMVHFKDELELEGHRVVHVHDYKELKIECESKNNYDGIILDLMFPPENGIPIKESDYGYRGGQILYNNLIKSSFPEVPFVILTAMDKTTKIFNSILDDLSKLPAFRGVFQKPTEVKNILDALMSQKKRGNIQS